MEMVYDKLGESGRGFSSHRGLEFTERSWFCSV